MPVTNNFIGPYDPNSSLDWRNLEPIINNGTPSGFTRSGSNSKLTLKVGSQNLDKYIKYAAGWADVHNPVGKVVNGNAITISEYSGINRAMPLAHPRYRYMYCTGVDSVVGVNPLTETDSTKAVNSDLPQPNNGMLVPCYPTYTEHEVYQMDLSFASTIYQVLPNSVVDMTKQAVSYYPPGSTTKSTFSNVWPEWSRFTVIKPGPKFETLSADQGQYRTFVPFPFSLVTSSIPQKGQVKIPYPSTKVQVTWYNVPLSFATGETAYNNMGVQQARTVFDYAAYTVNANKFLSYDPGTLLFEGVDVGEIEARPFPWPYEYPAGSGWYAYRNIFTCNLTLSFLHRDPPKGIDYFSLGYKPDGAKNTYNNIYAGHNLVPNQQTGKYYAAIFSNNLTGDVGGIGGLFNDIANPSAQNAIYPSFPHELLFCDPSWVLPYLP